MKRRLGESKKVLQWRVREREKGEEGIREGMNVCGKEQMVKMT